MTTTRCCVRVRARAEVRDARPARGRGGREAIGVSSSRDHIMQALPPQPVGGDDRAPTDALFVSLPGMERPLQMCIMRPSARSLCSDLPYLVPLPPHPSCLHAAGLAPQVLSAADVLSSVESSCGPVGSPSRNSAALAASAVAPAPPAAAVPAAAPAASLDVTERTALLLAAEQAAASACCSSADFSSALPPPELRDALARLAPADWRAAAAAAAEPSSRPLLGALSAAQLRLVAEAARSVVLCDLLLQQALPRLLREHAEADEEQHAAAARGSDVLGGARRDDGDDDDDDDDDDGDAAPLPGALSELLVVLLRGGSLLRAPPDEFDRRLVQPLHALDADATGRSLGARAAAQASTIYCVQAAFGAVTAME